MDLVEKYIGEGQKWPFDTEEEADAFLKSMKSAGKKAKKKKGKTKRNPMKGHKEYTEWIVMVS